MDGLPRVFTLEIHGVPWGNQSLHGALWPSKVRSGAMHRAHGRPAQGFHLGDPWSSVGKPISPRCSMALQGEIRRDAPRSWTACPGFSPWRSMEFRGETNLSTVLYGPPR